MKIKDAITGEIVYQISEPNPKSPFVHAVKIGETKKFEAPLGNGKTYEGFLTEACYLDDESGIPVYLIDSEAPCFRTKKEALERRIINAQKFVALIQEEIAKIDKSPV